MHPQLNKIKIKLYHRKILTVSHNSGFIGLSHNCNLTKTFFINKATFFILQADMGFLNYRGNTEQK